MNLPNFPITTLVKKDIGLNQRSLTNIRCRIYNIIAGGIIVQVPVITYILSIFIHNCWHKYFPIVEE
jgi:hypothetical protein